mgnify:CR=1 FL=1
MLEDLDQYENTGFIYKKFTIEKRMSVVVRVEVQGYVTK